MQAATWMWRGERRRARWCLADLVRSGAALALVLAACPSARATCVEAQTVADLSRIVERSGLDANVCLGGPSRELSFRESQPLPMSKGAQVSIDCGGRTLDLVSALGPFRLPEDSTLMLRACILVVFQDWRSSVNPPPLPSTLHSLFGDANGTAVHADDSFLQVWDNVRVPFATCLPACNLPLAAGQWLDRRASGVQFANTVEGSTPTIRELVRGKGARMSIGVAARTPSGWAQTVVDMASSLDVHGVPSVFLVLANTTVWSSPRGFAGAQEAVRLAPHLAATQPLVLSINADPLSLRTFREYYGVAPPPPASVAPPPPARRSAGTIALISAAAILSTIAAALFVMCVCACCHGMGPRLPRHRRADMGYTAWPAADRRRTPGWFALRRYSGSRRPAGKRAGGERCALENSGCIDATFGSSCHTLGGSSMAKKHAPHAPAAESLAAATTQLPGTEGSGALHDNPSPRLPPPLLRPTRPATGAVATLTPRGAALAAAAGYTPPAPRAGEAEVAAYAEAGGALRDVAEGESEADVRTARAAVTNAVLEMQQELQAELHEEQLHLLSVLGRGGFGTVYHGRWRGLEVAIKTVVFQVGDRDQTATVAAEAAIASNLQHANIVATYSHDICDLAAGSMRNELALFKFFLIQEFCNGGSMAAALDSGALAPHRLPHRWRPVVSLLQGTAAGMCHMHCKRICHGDLNPSNILFKFDPLTHATVLDAIAGAAVVPKVIDFGMAMRMARNKTHASNFKKGTPFYVSPEVARDHKLQPASDVYAFGVIMWELMTGCSVFLARPVTPEAAGERAGGVLPLPARRLMLHPHFPHLPAAVPLAYTLTMKACLAHAPEARPTFAQVVTLLRETDAAVASGHYVSSPGATQATHMLEAGARAAALDYDVAPPSSVEAPASRTILLACQEAAHAASRHLLLSPHPPPAARSAPSRAAPAAAAPVHAACIQTPSAASARVHPTAAGTAGLASSVWREIASGAAARRRAAEAALPSSPARECSAVAAHEWRVRLPSDSSATSTASPLPLQPVDLASFSLSPESSLVAQVDRGTPQLGYASAVGVAHPPGSDASYATSAGSQAGAAGAWERLVQRSAGSACATAQPPRSQRYAPERTSSSSYGAHFPLALDDIVVMRDACGSGGEHRSSLQGAACSQEGATLLLDPLRLSCAVAVAQSAPDSTSIDVGTSGSNAARRATPDSDAPARWPPWLPRLNLSNSAASRPSSSRAQSGDTVLWRHNPLQESSSDGGAVGGVAPLAGHLLPPSLDSSEADSASTVSTQVSQPLLRRPRLLSDGRPAIVSGESGAPGTSRGSALHTPTTPSRCSSLFFSCADEI